MHLLILLLLSLNLQADSKKIKVMVIDTGVDISHESIRSHINMKNWYTKDYNDNHGHGTHVAGILLKDTCNQVELISCKYTEGKADINNVQNSINCYERALKEKVDIINYSASGSDFYQNEFNALKKLEESHIIFVNSAGNNGMDLRTNSVAYPAQYVLSNIIVVGNLNDDETFAPTSNYGLEKMVWEKGQNVLSTLPGLRMGFMSGTSQAAALRTNRILKKKCSARK